MLFPSRLPRIYLFHYHILSILPLKYFWDFLTLLTHHFCSSASMLTFSLTWVLAFLLACVSIFMLSINFLLTFRNSASSGCTYFLKNSFTEQLLYAQPYNKYWGWKEKAPIKFLLSELYFKLLQIWLCYFLCIKYHSLTCPLVNFYLFFKSTFNAPSVKTLLTYFYSRKNKSFLFVFWPNIYLLFI